MVASLPAYGWTDAAMNKAMLWKVTCRRALSVLADDLSPSPGTAISRADDAVHVHRDLC